MIKKIKELTESDLQRLKELLKIHNYSWICDCKMCKLLRFIKIKK